MHNISNPSHLVSWLGPLGPSALVPSLAAWHYGMAFVVLAGFRAALGSMVGSRLPMQSGLCEVS
ncbi:uncharacterized protein P174DRAFT_216633 [Aspergillus novofumigatus IBT 16806]|uniref:Uncharacterized protein n=1 Tax=Aspergillus novofumigatus (strain IBT 16806) TaxID=1392255 RepID=A0A2I1C5J5_ASPN1|nr:uncharacterized protein P174DRAFT_216633 [Aspergillus novofumigatus IBT 16806]PKX92929.1 hypothetical protein P174DRAFT_216633 [Aspergillus novofumigatus IBT 16806]